MRTEKSRLRRSLMSLQDLMRRMRHLPVREQVDNLNTVLRGHYAYYGIAGISGHCSGYIAWWSVTGTKCFAAGVGQVTFRGLYSTRSRSGFRYCVPSCISLIGSCKRSRCCESA
jgi:hypothetical protein